MTPADQYRQLAANLRARARVERSKQLKAEWNYLADCYARLAEQAEKNGRVDGAFEPLLSASPIG